MSKRKWQGVSDPSEFRQGWEVGFRDDLVTVKQTTIFNEPFDRAKLNGQVYGGYVFCGPYPRVWFQRPPKAMKEPTALHSMVQVGKRQWIRINTVDSYCPWLEITSEANKVIRNNEPRCVWSSITNRGTPTPYTPEATNE